MNVIEAAINEIASEATVADNSPSRTVPLTIRYRLSDAGQKLSLLQGGDGKAEQFVSGNVPVTAIQHHFFKVTYNGNVSDITLNGKHLGGEIIQRSSRAEICYVDTPDSYDEPLSFEQAWRIVESIVNGIAEIDRLKFEADAINAEIRQREAETNRSANERAEQRRIEEAQRNQERDRVMIEWVREHGSDLLKMRLEDRYAWRDLANNEYADWALGQLGLPEGVDSAAVVVFDWHHPTVHAIHAVREVQRRGSELGLKVGSEPVYEEDDENEDDEDSGTHLYIRITTPTEQTVKRVVPLDEIDSSYYEK